MYVYENICIFMFKSEATVRLKIHTYIAPKNKYLCDRNKSNVRLFLSISCTHLRPVKANQLCALCCK